MASPPVRTLLEAGTRISIPAYTWFLDNFTIDQAAIFQGRWDSSSSFDSYIVPHYPSIIGRPLCHFTNWTFNETLYPGHWTLVMLPCDFTQNATVSITDAAQLVYAFTTQLLQTTGNLTIDGGAFLVWNFSLPVDAAWMLVESDYGFSYPFTDLGLLDSSELAAFLTDPAGFSFSATTNYGPPGSGAFGGPTVSPTAGAYSEVAYNPSNASEVMWLSSPLSAFWPGPSTPILVAVAVGAALSTTVVGASTAVAATATDSSANANPPGVTFAWSVLPPTLGVLSDPTAAATNFIATAAGNGSLEVVASWGGIVLTSTARIRVAAAVPLTLQLQADRSMGPVPLTVAFSALLGGAVVPPTYLWSFGDGSPADTSSSANHTFYVAATYRVALTAREPWGSTATSTLTITALPATTGPLIDYLTVSSARPASAVSESFFATASGGSPPYAWSWRGLPTGCSAGNVPTVACTLPTAGAVVVVVVVTDQDNATASASAYVAIVPSASGDTTVLGGVPPWLSAILLSAVALSALAFVLALRSNLQARRPPSPRS